MKVRNCEISTEPLKTSSCIIGCVLTAYLCRENSKLLLIVCFLLSRSPSVLGMHMENGFFKGSLDDLKAFFSLYICSFVYLSVHLIFISIFWSFMPHSVYTAEDRTIHTHTHAHSSYSLQNVQYIMHYAVHGTLLVYYGQFGGSMGVWWGG